MQKNVAEALVEASNGTLELVGKAEVDQVLFTKKAIEAGHGVADDEFGIKGGMHIFTEALADLVDKRKSETEDLFLSDFIRGMCIAKVKYKRDIVIC